MDLRVDKDSPLPLYYQLVEQLKQMISDGKLKPRTRLPSEMDLSRKVGISPMTVRQAYTQMVNDGLLYRRHGKGTFVSEAPQAPAPSGFKKAGIDFGVLFFNLSVSLTGTMYETEEGEHQAGTFSTELLLGIERSCAKRNFRMHLLNVNGRSIHGGDNAVVEELLSKRRMDGLILAGRPVDAKDMEFLLSLGVPAVAADCDYGREELPTILLDDAAFSRLALDSLARKGYERVALMTGPYHSVNKTPRRGFRMLEGFREAVERNGLKASSCKCLECELDVFKAEALAKGLMASSRRPQAILTDGDTLALGVCKALDSLGLKVPGDVEVLNYADAKFSPCAFICKPMGRMAELAVDLLDRSVRDIPLTSSRIVIPLDEGASVLGGKPLSSTMA